MKASRKLTLLSIISVIAMVFGVTAPVRAATPVVALSPSASTVAVGATTVVSITVASVENLYGIEVHLTFDPAVLEVVDANAGTDGIQIASGTFLSPDFVAQNIADNAAGKIDYAISQMHPQVGKTGSGTIATITFKGKASGSSAVNFTSVLLSDPVGGPIAGSSSNGTVTVGSGSTPSPTTTTTPSPTTTATTTPVPTSTPVTGCTIQGYHIVKAGETLYSIGRAYATRPDRIAACNSIVNASKIWVGMKLAIPVAPWSPIPAGPVAVRQFTPGGTVVPTPVPTPTTCRYYHTVKYGETLTYIGAKYGVSIWAIGKANGIYNLNLIYAGQVLCIP